MSSMQQKKYIEILDVSIGNALEFEASNNTLCLVYLKHYFPSATGLLFLDELGVLQQCEKDRRVIFIPEHISQFQLLDEGIYSPQNLIFLRKRVCYNGRRTFRE